MPERKRKHRIFSALFQLKLLKIKGVAKNTAESVDERNKNGIIIV